MVPGSGKRGRDKKDGGEDREDRGGDGGRKGKGRKGMMAFHCEIQSTTVEASVKRHASHVTRHG